MTGGAVLSFTLIAVAGVNARPARCTPQIAWVDIIVMNVEGGPWSVTICRSGQTRVTSYGLEQHLRLSRGQVDTVRALVSRLPRSERNYRYGKLYYDVSALGVFVREAGVKREYSVGADLEHDRDLADFRSVADLVVFAGDQFVPARMSDVRKWLFGENLARE